MPKKTKTPKRKPTREELIARLPIPGPGRDGFFDTPEEMQAGIDKYFASCAKKQTPPNPAGLAYALGFRSRQSLYDYRTKPAFSYSVDRAFLFMEMVKNEWLDTGQGSVSGIMFDLKNNHNWTDRQELTGANGQPLSFAAVTIYIPDNGRGPGKG